MAKTYICLTDADGQVRYFDQEELITQLVPAGLEMGGALAAACKNLIRKVREMREMQKAGTASQLKLKSTEDVVDKIVQQFSQVVERIHI